MKEILDLSEMWYRRWKASINMMHISHLGDREHYCNQAVIQQAQYVMYEAQIWAGAHK